VELLFWHARDCHVFGIVVLDQILVDGFVDRPIDMTLCVYTVGKTKKTIKPLPSVFLVTIFLSMSGCISLSGKGNLDVLGFPGIGPKDFTPSCALECANRLISLGETRSVKLLEELIPRIPEDRDRLIEFVETTTRQDMLDESKVVYLCRLLYEPKASSVLVAPLFGSPMIGPSYTPKEDWLHLPLVFSEKVPFLLPHAIVGRGNVPWMTARSYLDYCRTNGRFRKEVYAVPTRFEAQQALTSLLSSMRWKQLKWKKGEELSYKNHLSAQVGRMP
jgi:hypothetical protein